MRAFLRARRERLQPENVGLPVAPSRRARGLTRDEVAELADVSVGWYAQFELGRPINISAKALEHIARALRLDRHETHYLFALAGVALPQAPLAATDNIPGEARFIVEHFASPAQVLSRRFDVLLANVAARRIFTNMADETDYRYNVVYRAFTDPSRRQLFRSWEDFARRITAAFRNNYASAVGDPWFEDLINRLQTESPDFARFWNEYRVAPAVRIPIGLRVGSLGEADVTWSVYTVPESNGLQIAFMIPVDVRSEALLREFLDMEGELLHQHR